MTAPAPHAPAPSDEASVARTPLRERPLVVLAWRWSALLILTVAAFWDTLGSVGMELGEGTLLTYLPAAAGLCVLAAIGVSVRHENEPPIYDRDTDHIVGIVTLILATALLGLLNRRYLPAYLMTRTDLLALVVFLFAGCVLLFGLRPALRYRWVWVLSLSLFPLPYRVLVISLGNSRLDAGVVMLVLGVAATAVAVGTTRRRAVIGAVAAAFSGAAVLAVLLLVAPEAGLAVYHWVPAFGCGAAIAIFAYVQRRFPDRTLKPLPHRDVRPPTAADNRTGTLILIVFTVVLNLIGAPTVTPNDGVYIAGMRSEPPLLVPSGWRQIEATGPFPATVNGWQATGMRQILEQNVGDPAFDVHARPRRVVVDAVESAVPLTFDIYPASVRYAVSGVRTSIGRPVELPHGILGTLSTVVDDQRLLTYNALSWRWNNGRRTQEVTLISVDNHEPTAQFLQLRRPEETLDLVNDILTRVFRGNAVTQDLDPRFKDYDLLVKLAGDLIDTQIAAAERSR
ncbi:hypothetical protein MUG78_07745 [Gordonia alkaliphila]|uniref:hypothetical protein n=1 Tax=Gordonia alkaliphila TaxID=1053547 RepID=UPI001FF536DA|nr:hypothetical protein [Gordonia alkaliphila]MCK0439354.1 hypothetical protein [Gordonia alkaliphila]